MMEQLTEYMWILVAGAIMSFIMAFGIGANDVANAFGPSVGAKTLRLWQAVIIAAIFEFSGSLLMGGAVVDTISKGIADPDIYADKPEVLMLGMLCALVGAGLWIMIATSFELPVSTTHSIIGAIIGFSLCAAGPSSIKWVEIGFIVLSWFVSPVLAGLAGAGLFLLVRKLILRAENSLERGMKFYPLLIAVTLAVNIFFILYKGPIENFEEILAIYYGVLVALGAGVFIAGILHFTAVPYLRRVVNRVDSDGSLVTGNTEKVADEEAPLLGNIQARTAEDASPVAAESSFSTFFNNTIGRDIVAEEKSEEVARIHSLAEIFDPKTEHLFSYLQVATACFASFAHGANDVANSVAPFAMIYIIYTTGAVPPEGQGAEIWILAMGGAGIVIGLALYGYKVMRTLGTKLIKMTPSRGFAIELAAATVVVSASMIGIPISSTHCQVGATVAIGACEGQSGFNKFLFLKTFGAWMFTIFFSGLVTAGLFSFAYFSPYPQ